MPHSRGNASSTSSSFDCTDTERLAAASCRTTLLSLLETKAAVPPFLLLAVAAYSPLHLLPDAGRLLAAGEPGPVAEVLDQQIREPLEEQALRAGMDTASTRIVSSVSEAVRDQYEQNPYPRWVKMQMREPAMHFNDELRRALPFAQFSPLPDDRTPEVLVAGCGTGGDAIFVAQRLRGARVLAIDLSVGSLAYARRKTRELGLTNIEYAQADILELGNLSARSTSSEQLVCYTISPTPSRDGESCWPDCGPGDSCVWACTARLRAGRWSRHANSWPRAVMPALPMTFGDFARRCSPRTRVLSSIAEQ